ncbi:MAG TPA: hypothetical protein VNI78_02270 [Vicinamibacterales bacterium]|nr:hypothetical protein [Vicinamibacterales bacterium]
MELKNMKLPPPKAEEKCEPCTVMSPREDYPWGLRLHLDGPQLDALGVTELPKTDVVVQLVAKATVVSVSTSASAGAKEHRSVSLQITDMALGAEKQKKRNESVFYDSEES